jgi:SRSO17 transposase
MNGINFNLYTKNLSQIFHKIKLTRNKYILYFRNKTHSTEVQSFQNIQEKFIKQGRGNGWVGWHHHVTLSLLVIFILLMLTMDLDKKAKLLTVQDMKEIIEAILPKKTITEKKL